MKIQHRFRTYYLSLAATLTVLSCNVYRTFDTAKNDEAYNEEAIYCYSKKDYDCVVESYNKLSEGNEKTKKLCTAYLNQAGLTLDLLLNTVSKSGNSSMLGALATAFLPWTETKSNAASLTSGAAKSCKAFADAEQNDTSVLLSAVSQLVNCAMAIAHGHEYGDGTSGDACKTVTHAEIVAGKVTSGDVDKMCDEDLAACRDSISTLSSTALGNSGLSDLKGIFDAFPADLKSSVSATALVRLALKSTVDASR